MYKRDGIPTLFTRGEFPRLPTPQIRRIRRNESVRSISSLFDIRVQESDEGREEMGQDDQWESMDFKRGPVDEQ